MGLRLIARGTACVPHIEAQAHGVRRFVGRRYIEVEPGRFGFAPTGEPEEVADRAEYREAVLHGDADPADEATARACGVPFVAPAAPAKRAKEQQG